MTPKADIVLVWIMMTIILIFLAILPILLKQEKKVQRCLEEIAMEECEERGLLYGGLNYKKGIITGYRFTCKLDERELSPTIFIFLDAELEECGK